MVAMEEEVAQMRRQGAMQQYRIAELEAELAGNEYHEYAVLEAQRHALQHTATHCNTLQRTATQCDTLQQHTARNVEHALVPCLDRDAADVTDTHVDTHTHTLDVGADCNACSRDAHSETLCDTTHPHCITLQHTATHTHSKTLCDEMTPGSSTAATLQPPSGNYNSIGRSNSTSCLSEAVVASEGERVGEWASEKEHASSSERERASDSEKERASERERARATARRFDERLNGLELQLAEWQEVALEFQFDAAEAEKARHCKTLQHTATHCNTLGDSIGCCRG